MPRSRPTACGIQGSSRRFRCFRHVHVLFKPDCYRFCGGWRKSGLWFRLPSRFVSIPDGLRSGCGIRLWIEAWFDCSRCSIHDVASLRLIHGVFEFPQMAFCLEGVWGRLARSETIQSVPPQRISGERQTAAANATTSLDRDQILDPCELIHPVPETCPAAGSRALGLFRRIQVTLLMFGHNLTQELLTDIHVGFPNHRLTSGRGLHFLDRRGHPRRGCLMWGTSTRIRQHAHRRRLGVLLTMAQAC